eukprot:CAMPEP_0119304606 /NCGR_PEP_ID=MMETSP1333-20130426/5788_1 /TAXON_ID=418940 /ORGANISM="Scyphosphaera apsteinii, Strain RCC1455" /LENGTH=154 /DNA_ID=CAMNT_0007307523 /DNA_START=187 /DNA_END=654 /DNA_ORIENTATION=+
MGGYRKVGAVRAVVREIRKVAWRGVAWRGMAWTGLDWSFAGLGAAQHVALASVQRGRQGGVGVGVSSVEAGGMAAWLRRLSGSVAAGGGAVAAARGRCSGVAVAWRRDGGVAACRRCGSAVVAAGRRHCGSTAVAGGGGGGSGGSSVCARSRAP